MEKIIQVILCEDTNKYYCSCNKWYIQCGHHKSSISNTKSTINWRSLSYHLFHLSLKQLHFMSRSTFPKNRYYRFITPTMPYLNSWNKSLSQKPFTLNIHSLHTTNAFICMHLTLSPFIMQTQRIWCCSVKLDLFKLGSSWGSCMWS